MTWWRIFKQTQKVWTLRKHWKCVCINPAFDHLNIKKYETVKPRMSTNVVYEKVNIFAKYILQYFSTTSTTPTLTTSSGSDFCGDYAISHKLTHDVLRERRHAISRRPEGRRTGETRETVPRTLPFLPGTHRLLYPTCERGPAVAEFIRKHEQAR